MFQRTPAKPDGSWKMAASGDSPASSSSFSRTFAGCSPALCARIVTSVTGLADGYDLGSIGGALVLFKVELGLTSGQVGAIVGVLYFAMALGAPIVGSMADWVGRKKALAFTYILLIIGSLGCAFATSFAHLFAARLLLGFGIGGGFSVVSTYMTEVSPRDQRGLFVGLEDVGIVFGVFVSFSTTFLLTGVPNGWRWMLGLGAVCPFVALCMLMLPQLPESPRWEMLQGNEAEARASLRRLVGEEEATKMAEEWADAPAPCTWGELVRPRGEWRRRAMVASAGILMIGMLLGIAVVTAYMNQIFAQDTSLSTGSLLNTIAGLLRLFMVIFALVCLIDSWGRRPMALLSCGGCVLSLAALAYCYHIQAALLPWKFGALLGFYLSYSVGLALLPFVYSSEVLPTDMRSKGFSLGIVFARLCAGTMSLTFPVAVDEYGVAAVFAFLALVNAFSWLFIYFFVPETAGVSLEEIHHIFRRVGDRSTSPKPSCRSIGAGGRV